MFDLTRQIVSDKQVWISVIHRYLENICTNWNQHRKLPTSMDWTCRVHKIYCKTGLCDRWENNNLLYYERLRSVKYTTTMKSILLFYCDSAQKIMLSILLKQWTLSSFAFFFLLADFMGISACSCSPSFAKFSRNMCMAMKSASLANENEEVPLFAWPIV